jgi:peptidoglycan/LPS O-acetylase OafA/YrhL
MGKNSHNLDLLRSVAVLFVLFDHMIKFLGFESNSILDINWLGRLGVAFFFVHTSLVLMLSLERTGLKGWRMPVNFYVRRFFRLFPLSCLVVLFIWMTGIPQARIHPHVIYGARITTGVLLSNLTLTQNFHGGVDILGQLWSLPIELDMYLLLPLLFVIARRWPRRFVWLSWPLAVIVSFLAAHNRIPVLWRLDFLSFAPCFVPGVMAYALCRTRKHSRLSSWIWPVFLLVLAAVFMMAPSWQLAGVGTLSVGAAIPLFKDQTNGFVNYVTSTIAKYSYGIYLGHTFCIWAAFCGLHWLPWYVQSVAFAVLIFLVPWLLFVTVEQPGIRTGRRLADGFTLLASPVPGPMSLASQELMAGTPDPVSNVPPSA